MKKTTCVILPMEQDDFSVSLCTHRAEPCPLVVVSGEYDEQDRVAAATVVRGRTSHDAPDQDFRLCEIRSAELCRTDGAPWKFSAHDDPSSRWLVHENVILYEWQGDDIFGEPVRVDVPWQKLDKRRRDIVRSLTNAGIGLGAIFFNEWSACIEDPVLPPSAHCYWLVYPRSENSQDAQK